MWKTCTPLQLELIEWLVTPRDTRTPTSQNQWAKQHGIQGQTATQWKRDFDFRAAWDKRQRELKITPETITEVLDAMHRAATDSRRPDVQAGKLWLEVAGVYTKKTEVVVDDKRDLKDLTDAELDELLAASAGDELAARREAQ